MSKKIEKGDRIELISTEDTLTRLKKGAKGKVIKKEKQADDTLIWVKWDSGEELALIEGIDKFKKIKD